MPRRMEETKSNWGRFQIMRPTDVPPGLRGDPPARDGGFQGAVECAILIGGASDLGLYPADARHEAMGTFKIETGSGGRSCA